MQSDKDRESTGGYRSQRGSNDDQQHWQRGESDYEAGPRYRDTRANWVSGGEAERNRSSGYGGWNDEGSNADRSRGGQWGESGAGSRYGQARGGQHYQDQSSFGPGRYGNEDLYRPQSGSRGSGSQEQDDRSFGQRGYGQGSHAGHGQYDPQIQRGQGARHWGGGSGGSYDSGSYGGGQSGGQDYGSSEYGRGEYGAGLGRKHRGRPPKGYERSDDRLKEMLSERLMEEPRVDAGDVSITVSGGHVTLEGNVRDRRMKFLIEDIAEECGAKDVQNNLRSGGQGGESRDSSITGASSSRSGTNMSGSTGSDTDTSNGSKSAKKS